MDRPTPDVLPEVTRVTSPFPCLVAPRALPEEVLARLTAVVDSDLPWVRHESFYLAWMAEVTDRVDLSLRRAVAARLRVLTGLPLVDVATVTAQRMDPGDHALPHTDRPLLGYEVVRLVVQLDGGGGTEAGGMFCVHPDGEGRTTAWSRAPRRGEAVAFVLRAHSHHSVTPTSRTRRTVVFHVQHRGNDDAVAAYVRALFAGLRFDRLPATLGPTMTAAEAVHPDEVTLRAGCVAWALQAWGQDHATVADGYARSLTGGALEQDPPPVALARWAAALWDGPFDVDAWGRLAERPPVEGDGPIAEAWAALVGRAGVRSAPLP